MELSDTTFSTAFSDVVFNLLTGEKSSNDTI